MSHARCQTCGAPDSGEFVHCKYCRAPFSQEVLASAIPCPHCRTMCRWGKQRCGACQAWLIVSCVFCGSLSPHHLSACLQCQEPFAGAPERKMAREQAELQEQARISNQETMEVVGTVGSVAASFLGAVIGASLDD
jgi:hypothetical protein